MSLSLPIGCSVVSLVRVDALCSSRSPGREELEVVEESMLAEELALDFSDEEVVETDVVLVVLGFLLLSIPGCEGSDLIASSSAFSSNDLPVLVLPKSPFTLPFTLK